MLFCCFLTGKDILTKIILKDEKSLHFLFKHLFCVKTLTFQPPKAYIRSGTDGSSTACPVYLPDAVYINKTLIARACVVHDYLEIGAMASHESENLTENPKQPVVEPIRHIH